MNKLNIVLVLVFCSLLFGCSESSENRVLIDDLTNKGKEDSPIMYIEGKLFSGIGFEVYPNGQLKNERNYKDGILHGLQKTYIDENRRSYFEDIYENNILMVRNIFIKINI